jgi:hypothetical protein
VNNSKYLSVKNHDSLYRDNSSGAIINMNQKQRADYYAKKNIAKRQQEEINSLKENVEEIKETMKLILEKLSGER